MNKNINKYIDQTLLKVDAKEKTIMAFCQEAQLWDFATVCLYPCWVATVKKRFPDLKISSVVGFPSGAATRKQKIEEAQEVIDSGADEIDMVMNIGFFKSQLYDFVAEEIASLVALSSRIAVKVIIETAFLDDEEKKKAAQLAERAGAAFVKTSTGFAGVGATVEDIRLLSRALEGKAKIKASGGVKDYQTACAMLEAGASRLGTSSGVIICQQAKRLGGF